MTGTLLLLLAAIYCTYSTTRFLQTARRVRGELIDYESLRDEENDLVHRPVFRFVDSSGQLITTRNPRSISLTRRLTIGQQYDLRYNPSDPAQVYRDSWSDLWLIPSVLWVTTIIGLVQSLL